MLRSSGFKAGKGAAAEGLKAVCLSGGLPSREEGPTCTSLTRLFLQTLVSTGVSRSSTNRAVGRLSCIYSGCTMAVGKHPELTSVSLPLFAAK